MSLNLSKELLISRRELLALGLIGLTLGAGGAIANRAQTTGIDLQFFNPPEQVKPIDYFFPRDLSAEATTRKTIILSQFEGSSSPSASLFDNRPFLEWVAQREITQDARFFIRYFQDVVEGDSRVPEGQIVTFLPGGIPANPSKFLETGDLAYWRYEIQLQRPGETAAEHSVWVQLVDVKPEDDRAKFIRRDGLFAARRLRGIRPTIRVLSQSAKPDEVIELTVS